MTTLLTDTKEEFDLIYHVVFLGSLDGVSLICLIGTAFKYRELKRFNGTIVVYSPFRRRKSNMPRRIVYFGVVGIIIFCSFILLTTG